MADVTGGISQLLHEAAETHHRVYRIADGEDPDWASWYADWLISLSELPDLLVCLGREFTAQSLPGRWEDYYARRIAEHFSPGN
jgi:hypothetical protein